MRTASHTSDAMAPWPLVAVAAWVLPGLGHVILGHARRGVVVGCTLLGLFALGLVIGGIDVVDRRNDTLWFAGQALIGPTAFAADYAHRVLDGRRAQQIEAFGQQDGFGFADDAALKQMLDEGVSLAYQTSVGRVNELGTLYATLAGVMNLLVILDAVGRALHEQPRFPPDRDKPARRDDRAAGVNP